MFESQIRGQDLSSENRLTSDVFGVLQVVNRNILKQFLKFLGISLFNNNEIKKAEFNYWKQMDKRIPDLVIETRSELLIIESKLDLEVELSQIKDEYNDGINSGKKFILLVVSDDFYEPNAITDLRRIPNYESNKIKWASWSRICDFFLRLLEKETIDGVSKNLIERLTKLLINKGMYLFRGFRMQLSEIVESRNKLKNYFDDVHNLVGELSKQLEDYNIEMLRTSKAYFKFDISRDFYYPEDWMPGELSFAFGDKCWNIKKQDFQYDYTSHVFVRFFIKKPEIWVGAHFHGKETEHVELLQSKYEYIEEMLNVNKDIEFITGWEDLKTFKNELSNLNKYQSLEFVYRLSPDEIKSKQIVDMLKEKVLFFNKEMNAILKNNRIF